MGRNLVIAITGTPAAGKSTFAKELFDVLPKSKITELNDLVDQYKIYSRIDEMGSKVVKLKELEKKVVETIKENGDKNVIIVGHLVPEINIGHDITVVVRINLNELIKRLEARDYQKEKIKDNIVAESINYFGINAREKCKETYEVETPSEKKEMISYIVDRASGKQHKKPEDKEISRFDELLELVTSGNKYSL